MAARSPCRAGMTLVELLVVVAIIGLLAVTVLPNIANTAESRRSREAAREVSSMISKAQSRAIGRREWSGFMLAAVSTSTSSYAAVDLFLAEVPPVYRGDTVPALLTISILSPASAIATGTDGQLTLSGTMSNGAGVRTGDLIRFGGSGPMFEVGSNVTGTSIHFRPRGGPGAGNANALEDVNYQPRNTPWPPLGVPVSFEVSRQPVPAGSPISLADGRCVDLCWSGVGPPELTIGSTVFSGSTYRPFTITGTATQATGGASTSILFDGAGRLRQVVCSGTATYRQTVTGPVYLLIGRADRATGDLAAWTKFSSTDDSTGANWQYQDSYWVAIDPATSAVKAAPCSPPDPTVSTPFEKCVSTQAWIRQELLSEGR